MDYEEFKVAIFKMSGINLSFYKEKQMKRRIDTLIARSGYQHYEDYLKELMVNSGYFNKFINYLTINVSEFYRNAEQWEVLKKDIFPFLLKRSKRLKIWSAACSTGDEPYTLAMVLNGFIPLSDIKIIASDIDKEALQKARNGLYSEKSLEKLPIEYLSKYFIKNAGSFLVKDEIKNRVEFMQHDMLKDDYPMHCDLIVCRNVLIYFTEDAKNYIYKKFNSALKTEGILFVGSTEQIITANKYCLSPLRTFFYIKEKDL
ncbi:MAG: protein-glutamate O-methyltransferase CheR [Ruminiclostridium sp.]|nr:protein-glutamate O-methyltransferase CheR [Ruminiclostridium sp.]